jgi:hypothetical protein
MAPKTETGDSEDTSELCGLETTTTGQDDKTRLLRLSKTGKLESSTVATVGRESGEIPKCVHRGLNDYSTNL